MTDVGRARATGARSERSERNFMVVAVLVVPKVESSEGTLVVLKRKTELAGLAGLAASSLRGWLSCFMLSIAADIADPLLLDPC